ncbi:MAG: maleylpyruvate isomerase family mycothiol-dependent enzyme [Actinomycetota bacterium]|nr:maleylpyruvate isomerase family mycothiol-dependent enzyme [Actinomycetota bacterium]
MEAALAARSATPVQQPPGSDEVAAFTRAIADVRHTLTLLTTDHWDRPAVNGLRVGELVGHLIGTQMAMAAAFGLGGPANESADHIESTREVITASAALSPAEAANEFARTSDALITYLAHLDERGLASPARFGPVTADVRFLLLVRVFELWTHDNDLRRAVGLGRVEPDADRLWMMTRAVMPSVHRISGERIRIVLTGAGGGVWPAPGDEIAEIAIDSVAFCRRVANRMPIDDLRADISGDTTAANDTLNALATLALD